MLTLIPKFVQMMSDQTLNVMCVIAVSYKASSVFLLFSYLLKFCEFAHLQPFFPYISIRLCCGAGLLQSYSRCFQVQGRTNGRIINKYRYLDLNLTFCFCIPGTNR